MLSIIVPVYNNSDVLEQQLLMLIPYLGKHSLSFEILLVDDGSFNAEKTKQVARNLNCSVVTHSANLGKGAAIRTGMLQSKGEYCLFTDADIPFLFEDLIKMYDNLNTGNYDMVLGDRSLNTSSYFSHVATERRIASKFFSAVVGLTGLKGFPDTQCGIKAFTAAAAKQLFSESVINGFAFDVEILALAVSHNYRILRQPVTLRHNSSSSVRLFYHSFEMLNDILKIRRQLKK